MNEHPTYLVYQHLGRFFESRGLSANLDELDISRDRFITEIDQIGYFRIDAKMIKNSKMVTIMILSLKGKYTNHAPQLRELVYSLNSEDVTRKGLLSEVIVITPEKIKKKKNPTKSDDKGSKIFDKKPSNLTNVKINFYPYHIFSLDVPRAQIVPKHELVTEEEVKTFLSRERLNIMDLPLIPSSNPPIIWIGGESGQVVRIKHPSETAGKAYTYHVIV